MRIIGYTGRRKFQPLKVIITSPTTVTTDPVGQDDEPAPSNAGMPIGGLLLTLTQAA